MPPKVVTYVPYVAPTYSTQRARANVQHERTAFLSGNAHAVMLAPAAEAPRMERMPRSTVDERKRVRVDFDTIFQDVTALGATSFTGKDKKQWEAKRLASLGAVIQPRKEKMPLRMAIGVAKARKRRATAAAAHEKASGIITGKRSAAESSNDARSAREKRSRNSQQPDNLEPDNIRGPVMFVKR